jgi:pimeloyl-[acyl-carrier protein] methyl ester esterase
MLKTLLAAAAALAFAWPAAAADTTPLFKDSKVVVRDRFSDEIVGKGKDLVFIPGLASSRETWKVTAERLRGRYRLHLIQIAGFAGESTRGNAAGEVLVPTAEAIDAYLVEAKLTPATVVGHSLGGTTILYLAETHPEHLKKAFIVDSLPWFGATMVRSANPTVDQVRPIATQMRNAMTASTAPVTAESLKGKMAGMSKLPEVRQRIAEWGAASDRTVVGRAMYDDLLLDLRPKLSSIRTPILLLHPDNVPLGVPAGMMGPIYKASYADAPSITVQLVADSAHFIMYDQPQVVAEALDAWLAK